MSKHGRQSNPASKNSQQRNSPVTSQIGTSHSGQHQNSLIPSSEIVTAVNGHHSSHVTSSKKTPAKNNLLQHNAKTLQIVASPKSQQQNSHKASPKIESFQNSQQNSMASAQMGTHHNAQQNSPVTLTQMGNPTSGQQNNRAASTQVGLSQPGHQNNLATSTKPVTLSNSMTRNVIVNGNKPGSTLQRTASAGVPTGNQQNIIPTIDQTGRPGTSSLLCSVKFCLGPIRDLYYLVSSLPSRQLSQSDVLSTASALTSNSLDAHSKTNPPIAPKSQSVTSINNQSTDVSGYNNAATPQENVSAMPASAAVSDLAFGGITEKPSINQKSESAPVQQNFPKTTIKSLASTSNRTSATTMAETISSAVNVTTNSNPPGAMTSAKNNESTPAEASYGSASAPVNIFTSTLNAQPSTLPFVVKTRTIATTTAATVTTITRLSAATQPTRANLSIGAASSTVQVRATTNSKPVPAPATTSSSVGRDQTTTSSSAVPAPTATSSSAGTFSAQTSSSAGLARTTTGSSTGTARSAAVRSVFQVPATTGSSTGLASASTSSSAESALATNSSSTGSTPETTSSSAGQNLATTSLSASPATAPTSSPTGSVRTTAGSPMSTAQSPVASSVLPGPATTSSSAIPATAPTSSPTVPTRTTNGSSSGTAQSAAGLSAFQAPATTSSSAGPSSTVTSVSSSLTQASPYSSVGKVQTTKGASANTNVTTQANTNSSPQITSGLSALPAPSTTSSSAGPAPAITILSADPKPATPSSNAGTAQSTVASSAAPAQAATSSPAGSVASLSLKSVLGTATSTRLSVATDPATNNSSESTILATTSSSVQTAQATNSSSGGPAQTISNSSPNNSSKGTAPLKSNPIATAVFNSPGNVVPFEVTARIIPTSVDLFQTTIPAKAHESNNSSSGTLRKSTNSSGYMVAVISNTSNSINTSSSIPSASTVAVNHTGVEGTAPKVISPDVQTSSTGKVSQGRLVINRLYPQAVKYADVKSQTGSSRPGHRLRGGLQRTLKIPSNERASVSNIGKQIVSDIKSSPTQGPRKKQDITQTSENLLLSKMTQNAMHAYPIISIVTPDKATRSGKDVFRTSAVSTNNETTQVSHKVSASRPVQGRATISNNTSSSTEMVTASSAGQNDNAKITQNNAISSLDQKSINAIASQILASLLTIVSQQTAKKGHQNGVGILSSDMNRPHGRSVTLQHAVHSQVSTEITKRLSNALGQSPVTSGDKHRQLLLAVQATEGPPPPGITTHSSSIQKSAVVVKESPANLAYSHPSIVNRDETPYRSSTPSPPDSSTAKSQTNTVNEVTSVQRERFNNSVSTKLQPPQGTELNKAGQRNTTLQTNKSNPTIASQNIPHEQSVIIRKMSSPRSVLNSSVSSYQHVGSTQTSISQQGQTTTQQQRTGARSQTTPQPIVDNRGTQSQQNDVLGPTTPPQVTGHQAAQQQQNVAISLATPLPQSVTFPTTQRPSSSTSHLTSSKAAEQKSVTPSPLSDLTTPVQSIIANQVFNQPQPAIPQTAKSGQLYTVPQNQARQGQTTTQQNPTQANTPPPPQPIVPKQEVPQHTSQPTISEKTIQKHPNELKQIIKQQINPTATEQSSTHPSGVIPTSSAQPIVSSQDIKSQKSFSRHSRLNHFDHGSQAQSYHGQGVYKELQYHSDVTSNIKTSPAPASDVAMHHPRPLGNTNPTVITYVVPSQHTSSQASTEIIKTASSRPAAQLLQSNSTSQFTIVTQSASNHLMLITHQATVTPPQPLSYNKADQSTATDLNSMNSPVKPPSSNSAGIISSSPSGHSAGITSSPSSRNSAGITSSPPSRHSAGITSSPPSRHSAGITSSPPSRNSAGITSTAPSRHNSGVTSSTPSRNSAGITSSPQARHSAGITSSPPSRNSAGITSTAPSRHNSGVTSSPLLKNEGISSSPPFRNSAGITSTAPSRHNSGVTSSTPSRNSAGITSSPPSRHSAGITSSPPSRNSAGITSTAPSRHNSGVTSSTPSRNSAGITSSLQARHSAGITSSPPSRNSAGITSTAPSRHNSGVTSSPFLKNEGISSSPPFRNSAGITSSPPPRNNAGTARTAPSRHSSGVTSSPLLHKNARITSSSHSHHSVEMTSTLQFHHGSGITSKPPSHQSVVITGPSTPPLSAGSITKPKSTKESAKRTQATRTMVTQDQHLPVHNTISETQSSQPGSRADTIHSRRNQLSNNIIYGHGIDKPHSSLKDWEFAAIAAGIIGSPPPPIPAQPVSQSFSAIPDVPKGLEFLSKNQRKERTHSKSLLRKLISNSLKPENPVQRGGQGLSVSHDAVITNEQVRMKKMPEGLKNNTEQSTSHGKRVREMNKVQSSIVQSNFQDPLLLEQLVSSGGVNTEPVAQSPAFQVSPTSITSVEHDHSITTNVPKRSLPQKTFTAPEQFGTKDIVNGISSNADIFKVLKNAVNKQRMSVDTGTRNTVTNSKQPSDVTNTVDNKPYSVNQIMYPIDISLSALEMMVDVTHGRLNPIKPVKQGHTERVI
ncbi:mucin-5AC-like [Pecten maximus]|uniref:mucin-5AC-like n=1 Tax=Pecten maximus TaxID=6579 RepID=UPI0014583443|nr:mucin-5AC-like [Pecten maximus]